MDRPRPPASVLDAPPPFFMPDPDLAEWLHATFISEGAELENEDHEHLRQAVIGCLWTNVSNSRRGRTVIGQCEEGAPSPMQGKWRAGRAEQQIIEWFGDVPDFILTFDAGFASTCGDAEFCALVEHELYHAAQDTDEFGAPKFSKMTGLPVFALRGHDVEEFVGVVRRYGVGATRLGALAQAMRDGPTVADARIEQACGTCLAKAA